MRIYEQSDTEPTRALPGTVVIHNNRANRMASAGDESFKFQKEICEGGHLEQTDKRQDNLNEMICNACKTHRNIKMHAGHGGLREAHLDMVPVGSLF